MSQRAREAEGVLRRTERGSAHTRSTHCAGEAIDRPGSDAGGNCDSPSNLRRILKGCTGSRRLDTPAAAEKLRK